MLATMALTLLVASGVALAVTKIGTNSSDTLRGTGGSDQLLGRGGADWIDGRTGRDVISGGLGGDVLIDGPFREGAVDILEGGAGMDELFTYNGPAARDIVSCGAGRDIAWVDRKDIVRDDCERINPSVVIVD